MDIDQPINQNHSHLFRNVLLDVSLLFVFEASHKIQDLFLVMGQSFLGGRLGEGNDAFLAAIERTRADPRIHLEGWRFLIDAGILLGFLFHVGNVPPEGPLVMVVVGLHLSEAAQLAVGALVAYHEGFLKNLLILHLLTVSISIRWVRKEINIGFINYFAAGL